MRHRHTDRPTTLDIQSAMMILLCVLCGPSCASTSSPTGQASNSSPDSATITTMPATIPHTEIYHDNAFESFDDPFDDPFEDPFEDTSSLRDGVDGADASYWDPWEAANTTTFALNRTLDRFVLKPVATAYDWVMPDAVQRGIKNAFTNLSMPKRFFNSIFQGKLEGAGRELARFTINTSIGIGGLFDAASHPLFGIKPSNEDTGQTLAIWGADHGPYVVLPLLGPSSVRDGIGLIFDAALDPITYISFFWLPTTAGWGTYGGSVTNDRSLHLEAFDNIETTSLDFYISVQDAYFKFREAAIQE